MVDTVWVASGHQVLEALSAEIRTRHTALAKEAQRCRGYEQMIKIAEANALITVAESVEAVLERTIKTAA